MEETDRGSLVRQLEDADGAVVFLLVLICSLLLSLSASLTQRRQLRLALAGRTEAAASAPPVLPLRRWASVLAVGSLGFFLCLAIQAWRDLTPETGCAARRSAGRNLWASVLVLAAAVVRLDDLDSSAAPSASHTLAG